MTSSSGSVTSSNYVSPVQPQPQSNAERVAEKENDKDRDDSSKAAAVNSTPQPTVNTSGQTVGSIISVTA
jgi:hypothetical protein